jgi:hypothetical protein
MMQFSPLLYSYQLVMAQAAQAAGKITFGYHFVPNNKIKQFFFYSI